MNNPSKYTGANIWHKKGITGKNVVVFVMDTGVADHPDLTKTGGWGVAGSDPNKDDNTWGHGTHVAGIVAGKKYGVAPNATIIPIRISTDLRGLSTLQHMQSALDYVVRWVETHPEVRAVLNISFSATSTPSLLERINKLVELNVPVCVSSGNDGGEKNAFADYRNPIVVGNLVDENTMNESSTCWGEDTDVAVIGSEVYSCKVGGGYHGLTGTSMSSPAVAGMMALILSRWPDISEADAYQYLMSRGTKYVDCGDGHKTFVPMFSENDFTEEVYDLRETKYIAGIGEGKALIVRESAEAGAEKVGNLANGDMVTVLAEEGEKSLVATGTCGWIPTNYLTDDAPADAPDAPDEGDTDAVDKPDVMQRSEVGQLQELLHKWGFGAMVGEIDGKNGPKTKEAVRQYQSAMGLSVDGIAGPKTLAALKGEVIKPRITEEDMRCECRKYCDGYPNASTAGIRLLIERIWREHEKTRPGVEYHITNRATPAPDGAIAGGQRCKQWNTERGGASGSQHRYGRGADIIPQLDGVAAAVLRQECENIALTLNTKGGVGYGARYIVHVDVRGNKARWEY